MNDRNKKMLGGNLQRIATAVESIAVSANTIANVAEEIRIELKKKRFDDAGKEDTG